MHKSSSALAEAAQALKSLEGEKSAVEATCSKLEGELKQTSDALKSLEAEKSAVDEVGGSGPTRDPTTYQAARGLGLGLGLPV